MSYEIARERFKKAVDILADEKGPIKERLLIAYASQLSLVDRQQDLPEEMREEFDVFKLALSDLEMPYGYGEPAAKKLHDMSDDEAGELAHRLYAMFHQLSKLEPANRNEYHDTATSKTMSAHPR